MTAKQSGELWSFLLSVLSQGTAIQQDYAAGNFPSYEHFSARMDGAARERLEELGKLLSNAVETSPSQWEQEARLTLDRLAAFLQSKNVPWAMPWRDWIDNAQSCLLAYDPEAGCVCDSRVPVRCPIHERPAAKTECAHFSVDANGVCFDCGSTGWKAPTANGSEQ